MASRDVALFVDWDNLKIELNKKGQSPTLSRLWEMAEEHGRLVVAKAYADWTTRYDLRRDQFDLYTAGIEPVYVPCRTPERGWMKNSVDVKMSADCLDVSYQNPNVKVFVLVSGDVDFLHVAESLRRRGLMVVVIGVQGSTSSRLSDGVDARKYYDEAPTPPVPVGSADLGPVFDVMRRVLEAQRAAKEYPVDFARFKPLLKATLGDFDEATYGATKFKQIVVAAQRAGVLRIMTQNLVNMAILPEDEPSEEPLPTSMNEAVGERESVVTTPEILTELVCTYVELALANSFPYIASGKIQQYARFRGKAGGELPPGLTHAPDLEGIGNSMMGKHVASAIKAGAFKKVPVTREDGTSCVTIHLDDEHPAVRKVLNRPVES